MVGNCAADLEKLIGMCEQFYPLLCIVVVVDLFHVYDQGHTSCLIDIQSVQKIIGIRCFLTLDSILE